MPDYFGYHDIMLDSPAVAAVAVTPDDATDLATVTRSLYVGGTGDVRVILSWNTAAVTFAAVPAGTFLPIRAKRILLTGTTATNILALS